MNQQPNPFKQLKTITHTYTHYLNQQLQETNKGESQGDIRGLSKLFHIQVITTLLNV